MIIDARLTNQDIFLTYIDFRNAFGSIDHACQLATIENLDYPKDTVKIVGNIYTNSTTAFHGSHFGSMPLIPISSGTTQGDKRLSKHIPHLSRPTPDMALKRRHYKFPKRTTNSLTHLLHKGFGISNTSLLPYYIICIGQ
jgi:hypothetical protein